MGAMTCCHTATILPMAPHVMGEKRITTPLYIGAGLINLHNGIILILDPSLENAFLLWGSVNTFVYQRVLLVGLMFSNLDWELLYTYSLLSAASITYPLSFQSQYVYMLVILPNFVRTFSWKNIREVWFSNGGYCWGQCSFQEKHSVQKEGGNINQWWKQRWHIYWWRMPPNELDEKCQR